MTTNPPDVELEMPPLDVHQEYLLSTECGHDRDLRLSSFEVQNIAARLRCVSAIGAVLTAESMETFNLGGFMRGGLIEAIGILAGDAQRTLELSHERAEKAGAPRNQRGKAAA